MFLLLKNVDFINILKKLVVTNKNWMFPVAGARNFDRNFCQSAPDEYVTNLWSSEAIF